LLADLVDGLIAALTHHLLDLHLQNEMATALQVKAEMYAVRQVVFQPRQGGREYGHSNDTINAKNKNERDEDELPLELGIHAG
jgi:hypothetical protein